MSSNFCYILTTYNTQTDCRIKGAGKSERLVIGDYDTDVCLWLGKNFSTNLFRIHRLKLLVLGSTMRTLEKSRAKALGSSIYGDYRGYENKIKERRGNLP